MCGRAVAVVRRAVTAAADFIVEEDQQTMVKRG